MNPIISIIIPVFNRPTLVAEAIVSVLAQTNPNWELIVVDDGSTDNTWEVLESYAAKDERIRIFKRDREPKGANRCRNMGAEMARADYLFFLDSDDLIGGTFLETRAKYIEQYPDKDFIVFPEAKFETRPEDGWWYEKKMFGEEEDLIRFFKHDHPWLISGPVWKSSSFFSIHGFDVKLTSGQDWDIHVRAILLRLSYEKIDICNKPDCFVRLSKENTTISNTNTFEKLFNNKMISFANLMELEKKNRILGNDANLKLSFVSYFFRLCVKMSINGNAKKAKEFWRKIHKSRIISYNEWFYWNMYLSRVVVKNGFLKRGLESFNFRVLKFRSL